MRILCNILLLLFVTTAAVGQQINPVPDYIFRNQLSVGRNAATDTAAYMSIGPRFGAVKGFMPPMVVDTNAVTGTKRNGLLIFSVQLNNFAYWDSTTSRFRKITAEAIVDSLLYSTRAWRQKGDDSLGALIGLRVRFTDTASMLTPYLRKIDTTAMLSPYVRTEGYGLTKGTQTLSVDTGLMATRVRVQKAIDSLAATEVSGSGTTNRVAKFTASGTVGNASISDTSSSLAMTITSTGNVLVGTTSNAGYKLDVNGLTRSTDFDGTIGATTPKDGVFTRVQATQSNAFRMSSSTGQYYHFDNASGNNFMGLPSANTLGIYAGGNLNQLHTSTISAFYSAGSERMRLTSAGRLLVGTTTEGTNTVDINGTLRSTQGANFATTSGSVGIGTTSPSEALHVVGRGRFTTIDSISSPINILTSDVNGVIRKASIASAGLQGSGTTDYFPIFTSSNSIGNSKWRQSVGSLIPDDSTGIITFRRTGDNNLSLSVGPRRAANGNQEFSMYNSGGETAILNVGLNYVTIFTDSTRKFSVDRDGEVNINDGTDFGAYKLQVGGDAIFDGAIVTQEPGGGLTNKIPWKLGNVNTVSPTSPNRTITVLINGTLYYIHAKTTND